MLRFLSKNTLMSFVLLEQSSAKVTDKSHQHLEQSRPMLDDHIDQLPAEQDDPFHFFLAEALTNARDDIAVVLDGRLHLDALDSNLPDLADSQQVLRWRRVLLLVLPL